MRGEIRDGTLHYGDPPNIGCCLTGPSMNVVDVRVLEYWHKSGPDLEWARNAYLEMELQQKP